MAVVIYALLQHLEHISYVYHIDKLVLNRLQTLNNNPIMTFNSLKENSFDKSYSIVIWGIFLKINLFPLYTNVAVRNGNVFTGNNHNYFLDIQEEVR